MQLDVNLKDGKGWVNVAHGVSEAKAKTLAGGYKVDEKGNPRAEVIFRLYTDKGILMSISQCRNAQRLQWRKGNGKPREECHPGTDEECLPCACGDLPVQQPFQVDVGYVIGCSNNNCPAKVQEVGSALVIERWNALASTKK